MPPWGIRDLQCDFEGAYGNYMEVEFVEIHEELRSPLQIPSPPYAVHVIPGLRYRARRAILIVHTEAIEWLLVRVPARADQTILLWLGKPFNYFQESGITFHENNEGEASQ